MAHEPGRVNAFDTSTRLWSAESAG
jgi:hypothetical protein